MLLSSSSSNPVQEFRAANVKIQQRVRFGDGCAFPSLSGMKISELFITADHAVSCHVHVAVEYAFTCVWSPETQSVFLISEEGAAQRLEFKARRGQTRKPLSLCLVNHFNPVLGVLGEEFPNSCYNDTVFVFFGYQGYENTLAINAREKAYWAFQTHAGLCGVPYIKDAVRESEFQPDAVHKLVFAPNGACSHEHVVHVWTKGPIHQSTEPDGVATLSDAAGNRIRFQHTAAPGNGWDMCSVCVVDKTSVEGMEAVMPVCMTAPFQVAFPDCPLPGFAAAMRRAKFQERRAEYEAEERMKAAAAAAANEEPASGDVAAERSGSGATQKRKASEDELLPEAEAAAARSSEEEGATPLTQA